MKKLLLILLCLPMIFSCGDKGKTNKENKDKGSLDKEITEEMIVNGYTGKGTITWDGAKYVGEYSNGKCHGQGTLTYTDGTIEEGQWKEGKFMSEYH